MPGNSHKRGTALNLLDLPHELLTEIVARVGEDSLEWLARVKLTCKILQSVGAGPEVYRRAKLSDKGVQACFDEGFTATAGEHRFYYECRRHMNPLTSFADAFYKLTMKADVKGCLNDLKTAEGSGCTGEPTKYLKCIASSFTNDECHRIEAVNHFRSLKGNANYEMWIQRNRSLIDQLKIRMEWRSFDMMFLAHVPPICPDRDVHLRKRFDSWTNVEETDGCAACDVDRENEYFCRLVNVKNGD